MPVKRVKICRDPDSPYKDWHQDVGSDAVKVLEHWKEKNPAEHMRQTKRKSRTFSW